MNYFVLSVLTVSEEERQHNGEEAVGGCKISVLFIQTKQRKQRDAW